MIYEGVSKQKQNGLHTDLPFALFSFDTPPIKESTFF